MSKYIDADAIKEKKWQAESEACFYALEDVVSVTDIEEAPSIDIVRCKDCKHNPKGIGWVSCPMTGANTRKPDDFCSYGERRSDEQ